MESTDSEPPKSAPKQAAAGDDSLSDLRWIGKQKRKNGQLGFECQLWWF